MRENLMSGIDEGRLDKRMSEACLLLYYDSDGYSVPAPKHLRQSEKKLKRLQARLSRAKAQQDWPRVRKLQKALAKCHYRVKCRRNDFLHKTANDLLTRADLICFEDLKIKNLLRRPEPRQDEATGEFLPNGA
ncbi:MAG: transposase, partial [Bacteroidales bacterium]|nr:transposase [Bacteroidales bacterium]